MEFEDFKEYCLNKICNRHTFISVKCNSEFKIKKCYEKYNRQLEKDKNKKIDFIIKSNEKKLVNINNIKEEFEDKKQKWLNGEIEDLHGFNEEVDLEWEKVKRIVRERDKKCVVWNYILSKEQKEDILINQWDEFRILGDILDCAHIESVARRPDLKYDEDNIVLISRFFHNRFDQYKDLYNREKMTDNDRDFYLNRFKDYISYINKEK